MDKIICKNVLCSNNSKDDKGKYECYYEDMLGLVEDCTERKTWNGLGTTLQNRLVVIHNEVEKMEK